MKIIAILAVLFASYTIYQIHQYDKLVMSYARACNRHNGVLTSISSCWKDGEFINPFNP